ncbi:hypothetical protein J9253_17605 [Thiothrix litoralis]|jgi:hypothetical protein|uniref:Uncharacterized protein n=1 Tax=Thiothrix litoralis TaxID=2891210 RepID=A0ABX7WQ49_9GAMM|nr:hypothetical protein [Thiothrix litoralis]QTR45784.1 hypothetical protein J9253_17605 [Thiothrix litoralis]
MSAQTKFCLFFTAATLLNLVLVSLDSATPAKQGETVYAVMHQLNTRVYNTLALNP